MTTINSQEDLPVMADVIAETKQINVEQKALNAQHQCRMDQRAEDKLNSKYQMDRLMHNIDKLSKSVSQEIDDFAWVKDQCMREEAERYAGSIALFMGLEPIRTVPPIELLRMVQKAAAGRNPTNEQKSFCYADVVIEAMNGETLQYIAIEASYTADTRDTNRALRNASMLTEYTGRPARAAIVSVKNDDFIGWQIQSGAVYWHKIQDRDVEPD